MDMSLGGSVRQGGGSGRQSPCYRYGHSQAIVLTVETHTSQTKIALLYSTLQSNDVYNVSMQ